MMHPKASRAPELILTMKKKSFKSDEFVQPAKPIFTNSLDVWAMGCVFVQMSSGNHPFIGPEHPADYLDIATKIVQRLGQPNKATMTKWGVTSLLGCCGNHMVKGALEAPWAMEGVHAL